MASLDFGVGASGLLEGQLFGQRYHTFELRSVFLQAVQEEARELFGSDLAGLDQRSEFADRVKRQAIRARRQLHFALRTHFEFPALALKLHPHGDRVEPDGRRHSIGEREFADSVELSQLFLERSEEHTSELQSHSFISYAVFC